MIYQTITLNEKKITDFSAARNRLLKKIKGGWVLFLDSDERLSSELKKEIKNLNSGDFNGFFIKRKIIFLGKEIGEDKVLRLGKSGKGIWHRKVHETWNIKGRVGILKNYIIHETASSLHSYVEKMNNFSSMHAIENRNEGKKTSFFRLIFFPIGKFVQNTFSGRGFIFSMLQSFHSFLAWAKLWELSKK